MAVITQNNRYWCPKWPLWFPKMTVLSLTEINGQFGRENWPKWPLILYKSFILTIIWGDSDFGEWINVGDNFKMWWQKKDVGDMPIGHQH